MKFIVKLILMTSATFFLSLYMPWWIIFVVGLLTCLLIDGTGMNAFICGFLGGAISWLGYAWFLDMKTNSMFTTKMAPLFEPFSESIYLLAISGLIGAFTGGLGACTGFSLRQFFVKKKTKRSYS